MNNVLLFFEAYLDRCNDSISIQPNNVLSRLPFPPIAEVTPMFHFPFAMHATTFILFRSPFISRQLTNNFSIIIYLFIHLEVNSHIEDLRIINSKLLLLKTFK